MARQVFVLINDLLTPLSQARVSVEDRGFLYGDGFFETLRADKGRALFLDQHVERLRASGRAFRITVPEGVPWEERLDRLLAANGLMQETAAVKILLTRGEAAGLGLPASLSPTLIMYARPYAPPTPGEYHAGWPLAVFPEGRTTFIGRHKSLNYLFYLAARQYALDQGAREAIILEADGSVSEGAATSLVIARNDRLLTPAANSALSGVTLAALARGLKRQGRVLEWAPLKLAHLEEADGLWLTNSLMGIMPVAAIAGRQMSQLPDITNFLEECLTQAAGLDAGV